MVLTQKCSLRHTHIQRYIHIYVNINIYVCATLCCCAAFFGLDLRDFNNYLLSSLRELYALRAWHYRRFTWMTTRYMEISCPSQRIKIYLKQIIKLKKKIIIIAGQNSPHSHSAKCRFNVHSQINKWRNLVRNKYKNFTTSNFKIYLSVIQLTESWSTGYWRFISIYDI